MYWLAKVNDGAIAKSSFVWYLLLNEMINFFVEETNNVGYH